MTAPPAESDTARSREQVGRLASCAGLATRARHVSPRVRDLHAPCHRCRSPHRARARRRPRTRRSGGALARTQPHRHPRCRDLAGERFCGSRRQDQRDLRRVPRLRLALAPLERARAPRRRAGTRSHGVRHVELRGRPCSSSGVAARLGAAHVELSLGAHGRRGCVLRSDRDHRVLAYTEPDRARSGTHRPRSSSLRSSACHACTAGCTT